MEFTCCKEVLGFPTFLLASVSSIHCNKDELLFRLACSMLTYISEIRNLRVRWGTDTTSPILLSNGYPIILWWGWVVNDFDCQAFRLGSESGPKPYISPNVNLIP